MSAYPVHTPSSEARVGELNGHYLQQAFYLAKGFPEERPLPSNTPQAGYRPTTSLTVIPSEGKAQGRSLPSSFRKRG